jgi:hypothetical protein
LPCPPDPHGQKYCTSGKHSGPFSAKLGSAIFAPARVHY